MYCVFILSHNSPNKCITLDTLISMGFNGKYYIVIDNEDNYINEYKNKYNENNLIIYNKQYFKHICDSGMVESPGCALVARLAIENIVKYMPYTSFIVLDDDITGLKYVKLNHSNKSYNTISISDINDILKLTTDYIECNNIACISYATQNMFMGGYNSVTNDNFFSKRTVSNCFIRNNSFNANLFMCMYEDWCYSIYSNMIGELVMSIPNVKMSLMPQHTQSGNKQLEDGNAELYNIDDYDRNFLPVLAFPNCVSLFEYNHKLTPRMNRNCAYPKIISSKFRKLV